tara:strand:- start:239 stop:772 length:534 start_codon:yes stop_codon:yes gene_type:complete
MDDTQKEKSSMSRRKKILIGIGIFLLIYFVASLFRGQEDVIEESEDIESISNDSVLSRDYPVISLNELSKEIGKNYLVAQEKYINKQLIFKGKVRDLGAHANTTGVWAPKQYTNQNYIKFGYDSGTGKNAIFYCTVNSKNELMTVEVDTDVYVEGKIDAITQGPIYYIYINECKITE